MRAGSRGVAGLLLTLLAGAAWANPPWLGPIRSGGATASGSAGGHQSIGTGAFGNGVALVTWHDHLADSYQAIVGATLLRPDGSSLTPYGLKLSPGIDDDAPHGVAFDGNNFLVVWSGPGFFATRVSQQGVVLDSPGIQLPGAPSYGAAVAFDGTNYLVVWCQSVNSYDIVGVRVSPQGVVLDSAPILISADPGGHEYWPKVAASSQGFFVTWEAHPTGVPGEIRGARVSAAGVSSAEVTLSVPGTPTWSPSVSYGGGIFLVAWEEGAGDIIGRLVTPNGTPAAMSFTIAGSASDEVSPSAAWDGANFLVAWDNDGLGRLESVRVSSGGAVLDTTPNILASRGTEEAPGVLTGTAGERLVHWQDWRNADEDLFVSRLDAQGRSLDPAGLPVVVAAPRHTHVAVGAAGGKAVVAWAASGDGDFTVEALLDDGQTAMPLALPASVQPRREPAVAASPAGTLLAFRQQDDVVVVRLTDSGQVQDATPINVSGSDCAYQPDVAWDGSGWLVVWMDGRSGGEEIYGARVSVAGQVSPAGGFLVAGGGGVNRKYPSVACLDTRCLVGFYDPDNERAGAVLVDGMTAGAPFAITTAAGRQGPPEVVSNGTGFLVLWQDTRSSYGLYATRVSAAGALVDPASLRVAYGGNLANPSLAWDGQRYLVTFDTAWGERLDVVGLWLETNGAVSTDIPFPLATGPTPDTRGRAVALGPGRFALGWSRYDTSDGLNTLRVATRRVTAVPTGGACTGSQECTSGFCVDGVCCDTACGGGAADCQACSVAAGASVDGTCAVARAGAVCRASVSECDVEETCDGMATTCGADALRPDGTACTGGVCGNGLCELTDRPVFTSVPEAALTCGKTWGYSAGGGAPTVSGVGPFTFSVRMADGSALPEGLTLNAETGELSWTPGAALAGEYELELTVSSPKGSDSQRLRVEVVCKSSNLGVGCAAAPVEAGWAMLALALLGRRRRR
ncbi:MAG: putative Ig domain-containing protein [Myxococcota bacterium]